MGYATSDQLVNVRLGTTIYSDGFRTYDGQLTDGYRHRYIRYEQTFAHSHRRHLLAAL
jgi:hypothetical protein